MASPARQNCHSQPGLNRHSVGGLGICWACPGYAQFARRLRMRRKTPQVCGIPGHRSTAPNSETSYLLHLVCVPSTTHKCSWTPASESS